MYKSLRPALAASLLLMAGGLPAAEHETAPAAEQPMHKEQGEHKQCSHHASQGEGRHGKHCGHHKSGHHGYHMGMMGDDGAAYEPSEYADKLAKELGLDGQQQQDLQAIAMDYGERFRDLAKQMRSSSEKLRDTEPGDADYWPLAEKLSKEASAAAGESVILLSEMREKIYQVLTPEQREKMRNKMNAWREQHAKDGRSGQKHRHHHKKEHEEKPVSN